MKASPYSFESSPNEGELRELLEAIKSTEAQWDGKQASEDNEESLEEAKFSGVIRDVLEVAPADQEFKLREAFRDLSDLFQDNYSPTDSESLERPSADVSPEDRQRILRAMGLR